MSEVRVNNLSNENNTGGPTISGITTYSGTHFFVPPQGDTASRPQSCPSGSLRFNTDTYHLEYYRGDGIGWIELEAELTKELGGGGGTGFGSNFGLGIRGLWAGGSTPSVTNQIDQYTLSTLGDGVDFGDLIAATAQPRGLSSRTRALFGGGYSPNDSTKTNKIDYVIFATTGQKYDFGNLLSSKVGSAPFSNEIRGIWAGGTPGTVDNVIQYVTISTTGHAKDFGDSSNVNYAGDALASSTRGVHALGLDPPNSNTRINVLDTVEIMSTGNATDFGDLTHKRMPCGAASNATRGLFGHGEDASTRVNTIDYITIATKGNAIDFGDNITSVQNCQSSACSSPTRAVWGGGSTPSKTNTMDKVEIMTTGNAVDFGDLITARSDVTAASNGHGGL